MAQYTWQQTGGAYVLKDVDVLLVNPTPSSAKGNVFTRVDVSNQGGWVRINVPSPSNTQDLVYTFFMNPAESDPSKVTGLGYEFIGRSTTPTNVVSFYNPSSNTTTVEVASTSAKGFTTTYRLIYIGNPFQFPEEGGVRRETLNVNQTVKYYGLVCFLAGSAIRTPHGPKVVECLRVGDEVCVWNVAEKRDEVRAITWIGKGFTTTIPDVPNDEGGWPVCICKDAISDGVPSEDLYVTSEHCIFIDNVFVPARMLVNGQTIYYDKTQNEYEYYHIETQKHSVIWANDLKTESYLDTGNRRAFFTNDGIVVPLRPYNWLSDGAAPLATAKTVVEPIYKDLVARAVSLGKRSVEQAPTLVEDSELCLETETGFIIWPERVHEGNVVFHIPPNVHSLLVHSRVSRPCDVIGPYIDDRRQLGVKIGRIMLFDPSSVLEITCHMEKESLAGWFEAEGEQGRWTMGTAVTSS